MTEPPICPCEGFTHPQVIFNPPGRGTIAYRLGDYASFRRVLLLPLQDATANLTESELTNWHPGAEADLAVQMVEWWAYLADILTFYNERVANESYLRTAALPESVQRLIRILGYRPRPGIGASGMVAALVNNSKPFTLPQGFQIQSKPGPGKQPQIFELDVDTLVQVPDAIAAEPVANPALLQGNSVLLQGTVTTVKAQDELLLLRKDWAGSTSGYALLTIQTVDLEKDPRGKVNTRVTFGSAPSWLASQQAEEYRLLKSNQSAHVWQYPSKSKVVLKKWIHLESIARQIKVNDPALLQIPGQIQLMQVIRYTEVIWYANPDAPGLDPSVAPTSVPKQPPIPIPHTLLKYQPKLADEISKEFDNRRKEVLVRYDWQDVGLLIATPMQTLSSATPRIQVAQAIAFPSGQSQLPILLEDTNGDGIFAEISAGSDSTTVQLDSPAPSATLQAPLQMLFNLLTVSRGQTAPAEILGSGDASLAGQEFVLKKSPLTYLLSDDSTSGGNYKSTLRVWVDDIEWQEVPSFYEQPANARIFVTREDENQQSYVQFGDGVNGTRLPSGVNNVVARYRYGSGNEAPDAGSLNVIVKPYPNLKAIRNPASVGGGADPEPPEQIRRYAPQSVLTFGRAVSGDDYETIAAQTPGVSRAKVYWTWDAAQQRSLVKIYVGDDNSAVNAAKIALAGTADPNRPVAVQLAQPLPVQLTLTAQIESTRIPETVMATVKDALLHSDTGLFGTNVVQIGQAIYQSQIYATCMQLPGVLAVHSLQFFLNPGTGFTLDSNYRHDPGEGRFYQISETNLYLNWEVG
ncbi:MAG: hypothetical protein DCF22_13830 [Leptolyngbya sp.]|nr:MAG: hypothetical protein DCF22_13830 [Leptolyngbya sp.]